MSRIHLQYQNISTSMKKVVRTKLSFSAMISGPIFETRRVQNPSVAVAFVILFQQIKTPDPHAAETSSFMGMLDLQAISRSLLPFNESRVVLTKALGTLQAFSLIVKSSRQNQRDEFYDLHRLVRLAIHEWLRRNAELQTSTGEATSIMVSQFLDGGSHENRGTCRSYFPHALAILSTVPELDDPEEETQVVRLDLLFVISNHLTYQGNS